MRWRVRDNEVVHQHLEACQAELNRLRDEVERLRAREIPQAWRGRDYVLLPKEALFEFFGEVALPPWEDENGYIIGHRVDAAPIADKIAQWIEKHDLASLYLP